jgi:hypothetical protein
LTDLFIFNQFFFCQFVDNSPDHKYRLPQNFADNFPGSPAKCQCPSEGGQDDVQRVVDEPVDLRIPRQVQLLQALGELGGELHPADEAVDGREGRQGQFALDEPGILGIAGLMQDLRCGLGWDD